MTMAVDVQAGPACRPGAPKPLFDVGFAPASIYDDCRVAPDGHLLFEKPRASGNVRVIVDRPALLKPPSRPPIRHGFSPMTRTGLIVLVHHTILLVRLKV